MKKFFAKILFFIPLILTLVGINYCIDPGNIFHQNYVNAIAKDLLNGKNVTNIQNYDERMLQKSFIQKTQKKPEVIVLGSSRVLLIGNNIYNNKTCLNSGVSGAGIEDIFAIYNMLLKKRFKPEKLIIGLDPWMLNDNRKHEGFRSIENDYIEMMKRLNFPVSSQNSSAAAFKKVTEIISLQYLQESIKYIKENGFHKIMPTATDNSDNKKRTILFNGSISYDEDLRKSSALLVETRAKKYLQGEIYGVNDLTEYSTARKSMLSSFFDLLKRENVEVTLFLAPYHPIVYKYFKENRKFSAVLETEKVYRELAAQKGFSVIGSFDPEKLDLNNSYFYDGMHCTPQALTKIFNAEAN